MVVVEVELFEQSQVAEWEQEILEVVGLQLHTPILFSQVHLQLSAYLCNLDPRQPRLAYVFASVKPLACSLSNTYT